jgi:2-desacetyl-2-hydroxyethyl bacteriochlorophyllide A dehydrogenase
MTSMNALIFNGPRQVSYAAAERPAAKPGHVVVRVRGCGICGTDMHVYKGMPASWPVPGVRGHEIAGVIDSLGEGVDGLAAGDRVVVQPLVFCGRCSACRRGETNLCSNMYLIGGEVSGGFADYVAAPATSVFRVPNGLALEHAALAETLATPVHALQAHFRGFVGSVVVLGAGAQGLLTLQLARLLGAKNVLVSDVAPTRLQLARALGATHIVDARSTDVVAAAREMSGGEGVDLVVDAAGLAVNRQQTVSMLRAGGTGIFLALGPNEAPISFGTLVPRELHLHGTQCYTNADFARAIELLASGDVAAAPLVDVMPLAEGPAAFETLATDPGKHIKIVLQPA